MQTLGKPPLKTTDFAAGYVPNCESWVSGEKRIIPMISPDQDEWEHRPTKISGLKT